MADGRQIYLTAQEINTLASMVEWQKTYVVDELNRVVGSLKWAEADLPSESALALVQELKSQKRDYDEEMTGLNRLEKKLWYYVRQTSG